MTMLSIAGCCIGIIEIGFFVMGYVLFTEILDYKYRNFFLVGFGWMISLSAILFTVFYMIEIWWRYLIFASGAVLLVEIGLLSLVHESPRFLLTNLGDVEAATEVMEKISQANGMGEFGYQLKTEKREGKDTGTIWNMCRSREMMVKLAVCSFIWFSIAVAFYTMIFITPKVISNMYVMNIAIFTADMVSGVICAYFINDLGRKNITISCFAVAGMSFILISLVPAIIEDQELLEIAVFTFSVIGRMATGAEMFLIYLYTAELFPTSFRSTAFGICNFFGKIGGITVSNLFPICIMIGIDTSLGVGILMIITAVFALLLEETNKKPMKEVIENTDQEALLEKELIKNSII